MRGENNAGIIFPETTDCFLVKVPERSANATSEKAHFATINHRLGQSEKLQKFT